MACEERHLLCLGPGLSKVVRIVGGGTIDKVTCRGVQALIARIKLQFRNQAPASRVLEAGGKPISVGFG